MNYRVIVLLAIMVSFQTTTINAQTTGTLNLELSSISLGIGESVNVSATLLVDGLPTSGATLLFEDGTPDIEEAFVDLGNGSYIIPLRSSDTATIPPGNYTESVLARIGGEVVANATLDVEITANDFVNPEIFIQSSTKPVEESNYKLVLWGSDETEWMDLSIYVGGGLYYYLKNSYPITREEGSVSYNQTHVYFDDWLGIKGFSQDINFTDNRIFVVLRDKSFNSVNASITIVGDYVDPVVKFITPDFSTFKTRDITLEWEVEDVSNILKQVLFVDGKEWIPINVKGELPLDPSNRNLTFFLSVPKENARSFTVRLEVTDEFGNMGVASITLLFDNSNYITSSSGGGAFNVVIPDGSNSVIIAILVLVAVLVVVALGVVAIRKLPSKSSVSSEFGLGDRLENMFSILPDPSLREPLDVVLGKYLPRISKGKTHTKRILPDLRRDLINEVETIDIDEKLKNVILQHIKITLDTIEGELEI